MDTGQRLAAYLSGDLDADERTALEAELAGDPAMRAQLERIRAADRALDDLPEVTLPQGLSDRLDAALAPELDRIMGDELAARRARRAMPRWLPAAGAAAALVLVVGTGVVLGGGLLGGGLWDRAEDVTALDGGDAADMAEDAAPGMTAHGSMAGPTVTASGRTVGAEELASLAADPGIVTPVAHWLLDDDPDSVALAWRAALGGASDRSLSATGDSAPAEDQADTDDRSVSREALPSTLPPLNLRGEVTPDDLDDVARCIGVLFDGATGPVIPVYAELAFDADGIPVIVYVALSADRAGDLTVVEVWKVDRSSCDLREFAQHGG
jgi:hypothetical protein